LTLSCVLFCRVLCCLVLCCASLHCASTAYSVLFLDRLIPVYSWPHTPLRACAALLDSVV
jgi:hypothetical protein